MDKGDKIGFVISMCDHIKDEVIANINNGRIPENWTGFELRRLIALYASRYIFRTTGKRVRDFNNTVLVNDL